MTTTHKNPRWILTDSESGKWEVVDFRTPNEGDKFLSVYHDYNPGGGQGRFLIIDGGLRSSGSHPRPILKKLEPQQPLEGGLERRRDGNWMLDDAEDLADAACEVVNSARRMPAGVGLEDYYTVEGTALRKLRRKAEPFTQEKKPAERFTVHPDSWIVVDAEDANWYHDCDSKWAANQLAAKLNELHAASLTRGEG